MYIEDIYALVYSFLYSHLSAEPQSPHGCEGQRRAGPLCSPGSGRALGCCRAPPWETPLPTAGLQKGPHRSHSSSPELPQLCPVPLYCLDTSKSTVPRARGAAWKYFLSTSPVRPVGSSCLHCPQSLISTRSAPQNQTRS